MGSNPAAPTIPGDRRGSRFFGTGAGSGTVMPSWGDVNAALNGLVRAGLLTSFETNIGDPRRAGPVRVRVAPAKGRSEREVRGAVRAALARLGLVVEVSLSGPEPR